MAAGLPLMIGPHWAKQSCALVQPDCSTHLYNVVQPGTLAQIRA
jgi:hypothetical protein